MRGCTTSWRRNCGARPLLTCSASGAHVSRAASGGSTAPMEVAAWLGLRDAARPVDALALALFSDSLFSPPFVRLTELATSPTVELTIHFLTGHEGAGSERHDPANLCFARFRSALVHEGFFEEDGVIWSADGTPLVQSRQLAILMPLEAR